MTVDYSEEINSAATESVIHGAHETAGSGSTASMAEAPSRLLLHRRSFLKTLGAGAILCFSVRFPDGEAKAAGNVPNDAPPTVNSWFAIGADNSVTLHIGATELGQGIMSGLAQLAAEELRVPWSGMRAVHGIAEIVPAPGRSQSTGGSRSMMNWYTPIRLAAATAREMLVSAAAAQANADRSTNLYEPGQFTADNARVTHNTDGTLSYTFAALAERAKSINPNTVTASVGQTNKIVGQPVKRLDLQSKIDGSAVYGIDVRFDNMVYAAVAHCPTIGGTVKTTPTKPSGALAVVNLGNAVAVVASNSWSAMKMAESMTISWSIPPSSAAIDTVKMLTVAEGKMAQAPADYYLNPTDGTALTSPPALPDDTDNVLKASVTKIDSTYQQAYLAHGCMEVLSCTVSLPSVTDPVNKVCEIWAPTQSQTNALKSAAALLGTTKDRIILHTTFLGGGLGRKLEVDFIEQTVKIAQALKSVPSLAGKPVKLTWSRKQDFKNDRFRPGSLINVKAAYENGAISGFVYRQVSIPRTTPKSSLAGVFNHPYGMAKQRIEFCSDPAPVPVGYWRSVGESYNIFAIESAIDELAVEAQLDPVQFRKMLLGGNSGNPIARGGLNVLDQVVQDASSVSMPAGAARGTAFMSGFGSLIAMIVEISVDSSSMIRVRKVFAVADCGIVVNPDSVRAQIEGGIVHGISAALWGEVKFTNGVASPVNFSNNRVMRMSEAPTISINLINTGAISVGGVGELAVPVVAPAIANAYAKLRGIRVRKLPFHPGATMGGL